MLNFYPTITLDGELWVAQGPTVDFTAATWTKRALVQAQNWNQGGTRGANYFNRYRLTFKTSAGNQPSFGLWEWETHRWRISSSGASAAWVP